MFSTVALVLCVCVAVVYSQERDPECSPHQFHEDRKCCTDLPSFFTDSNHKSVMESCGMRGKGKGPGGSPEEADCAGECVFKAYKLITDEGKIDTDAISAMAKTAFTDAWATPGVEAVQKCLQTIESDVDSSSKCKSGSHHMMHCVKRHLFLNCPDANWSTNAECQDAKARTEKCEPPKRHPHS